MRPFNRSEETDGKRDRERERDDRKQVYRAVKQGGGKKKKTRTQKGREKHFSRENMETKNQRNKTNKNQKGMDRNKHK